MNVYFLPYREIFPEGDSKPDWLNFRDIERLCEGVLLRHDGLLFTRVLEHREIELTRFQSHDVRELQEIEKLISALSKWAGYEVRGEIINVGRIPICIHRGDLIRLILDH